MPVSAAAVEVAGVATLRFRFAVFAPVDDGANAADHSLVVGLRNSHDHSFCLGVSLGSRVFVCDNLAFSGEVRVARKHTNRIAFDLPKLVNGAVGLLGDIRRTLA